MAPGLNSKASRPPPLLFRVGGPSWLCVPSIPPICPAWIDIDGPGFISLPPQPPCELWIWTLSFHPRGTTPGRRSPTTDSGGAWPSFFILPGHGISPFIQHNDNHPVRLPMTQSNAYNYKGRLVSKGFFFKGGVPPPLGGITDMRNKFESEDFHNSNWK